MDDHIHALGEPKPKRAGQVPTLLAKAGGSVTARRDGFTIAVQPQSLPNPDSLHRQRFPFRRQVEAVIRCRVPMASHLNAIGEMTQQARQKEKRSARSLARLRKTCFE